MQRYVGTLRFHGQPFQGWQTQKQGRSVQEQVEKTLSKMLNQDIHVHGASRTDAGVHAKGFVFHFDGLTQLPIKKIQQGFNRMVDPHILLTHLKKVPQSFEARYQHSRKTYTYCILQGERDPFIKDTVMHVPFKLSILKLKQVAKLFLGTHNFQNFTTKKEDGAYFIRTIFQSKVTSIGRIIKLTFVGDGFMTYMVRMMVGTMIAYAQHKISLETIQQHIEKPTKGNVSYKAEAQGLTLEKVTYEK
jgi:tRNA pseudouridine38-40 synthase